MNRKVPLMFAGIFALAVFLSTFASAAAVFEITNIDFPTTIDHSAGTFEISFDLGNNGDANGTMDLSTSNINGANAGWTLPGSQTVTNETLIHVTIPVTFDAYKSGAISGKVIALDSEGGTGDEFNFNVDINEAPSLKITQTVAITRDHDGEIKVMNDGNINFLNVDLSKVSGDFDVEFSDSSFALNAGDSKLITLTPKDLGEVDFAGKSVEIQASANDGTNTTITLKVAGSFCSEGETGNNLTITDIDFDRGDDEEWEPLDEIEIVVEVKNNGDDKIRDIRVEMGLFDSSGNNVVNDLDFHDSDEERQDLGDLRDGKDDTVTFKFRVPADLEEDDYDVVFKAYPKGDEDVECDEREYSNTVDLVRPSDEDEWVIVSDFTFPTEAICGETVNGRFTVFNLGDDKQEQIRVLISSPDFGIDEEMVIKDDLKSGKEEKLDFSFTIPEGLTDGQYDLKFDTEYDYDKDDDIYKEFSSETFKHRINVFGCSTTTPPGDLEDVSVDATLDSDAVAGEELTVTSVISNTGDESKTVIVSLSNYNVWASNAKISDRIVTVPAGSSKEISFTFDVEPDADGAESFAIELSSAGKLKRQVVEVFIEGAEKGSPFFDFVGKNGTLWLIGAINVILIVLILIVAVRLASRR